MNKAWGIFVNFNPCLQQYGIVRTGKKVNYLLIGDAGSNNPNVDPCLRGNGKGFDHIAVDDQVRGRNVNVFLRFIQEINIHILPHGFGGIGRRTEGLHISLRANLLRGCILGEIGKIPTVEFPNGQKHSR